LDPALLDYRVEQVQKSVDAQWDQWKTLDSRTQFLIPLVTALFALALVNLGFEKIPTLVRSADPQNAPGGAYVLLIGWLLVVGASLVMMLSNYWLGGFNRPFFPPDNFSNKAELQKAWLELLLRSHATNIRIISRRTLLIEFVYILVSWQTSAHIMLVLAVRVGNFDPNDSFLAWAMELTLLILAVLVFGSMIKSQSRADKGKSQVTSASS
jgi:hypothetical protein